LPSVPHPAPAWTWTRFAALETGGDLQLYGPNPLVEAVAVDGRPARLILPGPGQPLGPRAQAALIVEAPRPVPVHGEPHRLVILHADPDHVRAIGASWRWALP